MELTKELSKIFHQQNERSLRFTFYTMAVVTILGFAIEMLQLFNRSQPFAASLDLYQVIAASITGGLVLINKMQVRIAAVIFIYSQLFVALLSIVYFGWAGTLQEKRYIVELLLHLIYIAMIGYLSGPKHCLYYGAIALCIAIGLNIAYWNDATFVFLPLYIPILIGFPVGLYILLKNSVVSFSNNYLSTIALKQQAESIKEQNIQIKRLNLFRKDLSTMIVHDLKNPLNIILSKSGNAIIRRSGKRMMNLVQNILDVEKYSDTEFVLNKESFPIVEEVQLIMNDMYVLSEERNISFRLIGNEEFIVYADKRIVCRILENLLTNALTYSKINSQIDIKVYNYSANKIKVEIVNFGSHIPNDSLESIFDKYSQLNDFNAETKHNSGLGLTFCKLALDAHKQKISARNIAGGVSFEFTLEKKSATPPCKQQLIYRTISL